MISDSDTIYRQLGNAWRLHHQHPWKARWWRRSAAGPLIAQYLGIKGPAIAHLFNGGSMHVIKKEVVSRGILAFGYSEPDLTALLCDLIEPGNHVIDIGTHFGYESILMSLLVCKSGQVEAFEPNPEAYSIAKKNLAAFPWTQLYPLALGDSDGKTFYQLQSLTDSAFGHIHEKQEDSGCCIQVDSAKLDTVLDSKTERIALIKCDAEGQELPILRGAHSRLLSDRPALVLETGMPDPSGKASDSLLLIKDFLAPMGYEVFSFSFEGVLRVGPWNTIPTGHANTLFLTRDHPHFTKYQQGWERICSPLL